MVPPPLLAIPLLPPIPLLSAFPLSPATKGFSAEKEPSDPLSIFALLPLPNPPILVPSVPSGKEFSAIASAPAPTLSPGPSIIGSSLKKSESEEEPPEPPISPATPVPSTVLSSVSSSVGLVLDAVKSESSIPPLEVSISGGMIFFEHAVDRNIMQNAANTIFQLNKLM